MTLLLTMFNKFNFYYKNVTDQFIITNTCTLIIINLTFYYKIITNQLIITSELHIS